MAPSKNRMLGSPEKSYKNKKTKSKQKKKPKPRNPFLSENQILDSLLEESEYNESDYSSDDEITVAEPQDPDDAQAPTNYELEEADDSDSDAGGGPMDLDSSDEDEDEDEPTAAEPTAAEQLDEATPTSLGAVIESRITRSASTNAASTTNEEPPPTPSTSRDATDSLADTPTSR